MGLSHNTRHCSRAKVALFLEVCSTPLRTLLLVMDSLIENTALYKGLHRPCNVAVILHIDPESHDGTKSSRVRAGISNGPKQVTSIPKNGAEFLDYPILDY